MARKPKAVEPAAPAETMRIEFVPLAEVARWPRNPKKHDLVELRRSLQRFGFVEPLIEDATTGRLVAGHGRLEALLDMHKAGMDPPARIRVSVSGAWSVPVIRGVPFKSELDAEAYLVASNTLGVRGGWDDAALLAMLSDIGGESMGFAGTGWDNAKMDALAAAIGGEIEAKPVAPDAPVGNTDPKLGDLEYRVVADCTSESDQADLLARFASEGRSCRALIS